MDLESKLLDNCTSCGDNLFVTLIHCIYKNYSSNSSLIDSILKPLLEKDNTDSFDNIHSLQEVFKRYLNELGKAFITSLGSTFHSTVDDGSIHIDIRLSKVQNIKIIILNFG